MPHRAKFELSFFDMQLQYELHPDLLDATLKYKSLGTIDAELKVEGFRVQHEFRDVVVRGYADDHLERYFQHHQRMAIQLMNLADNRRQIHEVYGIIFDILASILDAIEQNYSKYFDLNAMAPDSYYLSSCALLTEERTALRAQLLAKKVEPALQEIILSYLRNFCRRKGSSFRELIYAKMFSKHLRKVLEVKGQKNWTDKLIVELLYLNFNKVSFLVHCRYVMAAQAEGLNVLAEQQKKFYWFSKKIEALKIKPNVAYRVEREGMQEHLLAYVAKEMIYLSELKKLNPEVAGVDFKVRAEQVAYKLPLNLSVPQLALIVQLFMDVKVFVVEKGQIATVMKFFSDHVTTMGTSEMSAANLNKHRLQGTARVCENIEQVLESMLTQLRTVYMMKPLA